MTYQHKVLIVDDEKKLCEILSGAVKRFGYQSLIALSGEEALHILQEDAGIHIALTDLVMPRVDGYQVIEYIAERSLHIPVIVMTAYSSLESAIRALRLGAYDYIVKPFNLGAIQVALTRASRYLEQLQAEEAARQAEERYRQLFEDSMDPIVITDMEGRLADANRKACEMLGYSKEELFQMRVRDFRLPQSFWARVPDMKAGQDVSVEIELPNRQGQLLSVELHVKKVVHRGQEYLQGIARDMSERRTLEALRQDMTRMLVHDLRSPLSVIMSGVDMMQMLRQEGEEKLPLDEFLEMASYSGRKLLRLVDTMLDFYRLEEGRIPLHLSSFSPAEMVSGVVQEVSSLAVHSEIALTAALPDALPMVEADRELMERVLGNLLDNALKFTPRGGRVAIEVSPARDDYLTVSVMDNGPGIPVEYHERVFDKFGHVRSEGRRRGIGLGLPFCKLAVEAHGGRIWLESPSEGGSTFRFTMPLAKGIASG